jgi:hypothetical protein
MARSSPWRGWFVGTANNSLRRCSCNDRKGVRPWMRSKLKSSQRRQLRPQLKTT